MLWARLPKSPYGTLMPSTAVPEANEHAVLSLQESGRGLARPRAGNTSMIIEDFGGSESSDYECPACGRTFDTLGGMKNHHTQFCDKAGEKSIAGTEVECDECGARYRMNPAEAREYDRHFCDTDCKGRWQAKHLTGEAAHNWRGGPSVHPCANCGRDVERRKAVAERLDKVFCDFACRGEWRSEHWVGEDNPNYNRVAVECSRCGDKILVTRSWRDSRESTFCGDECYRKARSEKYSGEGNPMYGLSGEDHPAWASGERFSYGSGWTDAKKEAVRERQNRRCAGCGVHDSNLSQSLDVHHVQKARSVDDERARNDDSILVAVCRPCHRQWEQMSPLRPQTPYLD